VTVLEQILEIEELLPKWVRDGRKATEQEVAHITIQQHEIILHWWDLRQNYKDPNQRDAVNIANVGRQAQGKSTFTRKEVDKYYRRVKEAGFDRPVLIYLPKPDRNYIDFPEIDAETFVYQALLREGHPDKWTDGIRVWYGKKHAQNIKLIDKYFVNGLCVYEEANEWMTIQGAAPKWQLTPFSQNRHRAVDNMICLHRFMDIPHSIRGFFKMFNVFKTDDHPPGPDFWYKNGFSGDAQKFWRLYQEVMTTEHDHTAKIQKAGKLDMRF
jgi:hypothetical protein